MKILLFNGSPRPGNTKFAIETIADGLKQNLSDAEVDIVALGDKKINCCTGCNYCIDNKGVCVFNDDMTEIIEKVREADIMIFGSPVYWWGITAQLKIVIDRLYALSGNPGKGNKKIGMVITGQDTLDGPQYRLISEQFACISEHLGWEIIFDKSICADGPEDVKNNGKEAEELSALWKKV